MPESNDRNFTCPNGHTFDAEAQATPTESLACPECGSEVVAEAKASSGAARSLWEVMGRPSNDEASSETGDGEVSPVEDTPAVEEESETDDPPEPTERPRGLWAMMGAAPAEDTTVTEGIDTFSKSPDSDDAATDEDDDFSELESEFVDTGEAAELDDDDSDDDFGLADDDEEDGWEVDSPLHDLDAADPSLTTDDASADSESSPKLPRGTGTVVAGVLSVLLCGLSLLPSMVAKFPATIVGGYALLLGYQTLGSNRRLKESVTQVLAPVGMLLGLVGIFAGPAYLNQLGESWRNRSAKEVIESNLGSINKALNDYAIEKGHFPAGGTFEVDQAGLEVGMHSWTTSLLPYLGHMEIYNAIELSKPWNDEANAPAMQQPISTLLTSTMQHEPTHRGLATTHFAGVGGLIQTDQGLLPTGIFNKNSAIRIEDVTDGMSQTIIVGEIARALPAWGDPENWRTIEGPLNKRLSSFGNSVGTGAHFLQGDGSVRFFSNKTSPEVLQRLTTRNAGD
ncbi:MAG: DUF1559 family PulG-like putative transporter [Planctomycetales bacterium]|jgi:hypothetical protein